MAQIYTGLDIGTKSVKLVQLKHGRKNLVQLVNVATAEIPLSPAEQNPENFRDEDKQQHSVALIDTVRRLLTEHKIHATHLVTAVPKHLTTVRSITLPTDSPSEIEQMIRFEAGKHIPFLSEDDILDFQIMGTSTIGGSQILLAAVRKPVVDEHLAFFRKLGVEPEIVSVSSVAIYSAMIHNEQLEEGTVQVLIDIGASMTDLTLVQNRILVYSRSTTVAGNQLIQHLQTEFQIDERTAESLLPLIDLDQPDFGIDKFHRERIAQAINPWLEHLDNEIKQSLEYFRSESGVSQIDSIILSGGLSQLKGMVKHLAKELNIEIIPADPLKLIKKPDTKTRGFGDLVQLSSGLNVAVGLALRGAETGLGTGINLLPVELLKKRKKHIRQRNYIAIGALVSIAVLASSYAGYREYTYRGKRIQEIIRQAQEIKPLTEKLKGMQAQVERIKGMFSPEDEAINSLALLSQIDFIPKQVAITRFDYKRNTQLTIDGTALSLPDAIAFRETLAKSGLFEIVKLRETRTGPMEGKTVQFFTIECKLIPSKNVNPI